MGTVKFCDKCKKEITSWVVFTFDYMPTIELCDDCADELRNVISMHFLNKKK